MKNKILLAISSICMVYFITSCGSTKSGNFYSQKYTNFNHGKGIELPAKQNKEKTEEVIFADKKTKALRKSTTTAELDIPPTNTAHPSTTTNPKTEPTRHGSRKNLDNILATKVKPGLKKAKKKVNEFQIADNNSASSFHIDSKLWGIIIVILIVLIVLHIIGGIFWWLLGLLWLILFVILVVLILQYLGLI